MSANTPERGGTHNAVHGGARDSTVVQARHVEFHQHVGGRDPAAPPMQVPPPPPDFVNHEATIEWISGLMDPDAPPRVVVCQGPLGIGKTSLLHQVAYATSAYFTGGQLTYEYERGAREDSDAALAQFLRSLGVASEALSPDPRDWPGAYRTHTRGRRLLVVVEGAWEPAQIRALIPSGPGSLVLASGDGPDLGELTIAARARLRDLEPLDAPVARTLLQRLVDFDLTDEDTEDVDHLLAVCAGLPLALVLVGARLDRGGPGSARELADRVRGPGGVLRAVGDERSNLDVIFQSAYAELSDGAAVLYRTLGTWPGAAFDRSVALAVADEARLDELVAANLVETGERGALRFRHALIRTHARDRAEAEDGAEVRADRLRRMLDAAMVVLGFAERLVRGERLRVVDLDALLDGAEDPFHGDRTAASRWLSRERPTLMAVVLGCLDLRMYEHTWRFAELACALYLGERHVHDWVATGTAGADAARMAGNAAAEARLSALVSRPLRDLGRDEEARARITRAVELAQDVDDELLRGSVWEFHGRFLEGVDPDAAVAAFDRSLRHNRASDDPRAVRGSALALLFRGGALISAGRPQDAAADIATALSDLLALPEGPDHRMAARARVMLGRAHAEAGHDRAAVTALNDALEGFREHRKRSGEDLGYYEAEAHHRLAEVLGSLGATGDRRRHLEIARDLYDRVGSPRAGEVTGLLEEESPEG
ncbi:hypothetical protein BJF83_19745 [Nocardiopsis sp. CNR-923]|uniref:tetratricopeptide repeat protein n=1 Tax=Nocardiopsis sp. CNR-923 TaxID=1904965 RepID=UPI00095BB50D|nr:tetratricopeptide repeat protein [Nocardiopsis sp. CNR-923]OLT27014.1 hypothetical protein BJF83_19745 [Nocardiopsis sp. CNR-923]